MWNTASNNHALFLPLNHLHRNEFYLHAEQTEGERERERKQKYHENSNEKIKFIKFQECRPILFISYNRQKN